MWFCAVRACRPGRAPGSFRTVQVGRESVLITRSRNRRDPGLLQRLPAPRREAVHRGHRRGQARLPVPVSRLDLRPRRQADRGTEPHQDARHRPARIRPAQDRRARMARLRLGLPGRRVRRRSRTPWSRTSSTGSVTPRRSSTTTSSTWRSAAGSSTTSKANWKLIIENFMECYHCATIHPELTEVLPGVRRRPGRPVLRRPRRRIR